MTDKTQNQSPKLLVGLDYTPGEGLPSVLLKASGEQAEALLRQHNAASGPPLVEDRELARALYRLPVDAPIGRELFGVVAALLTHVYAIEARLENPDHA